MKKILPLTLFFFLSVSVFSQRYAQPQTSPKKEDHSPRLTYATKYDSIMHQSQVNKTWGIFGCVVGPVFIGGGIAWMALAPNTSSPPLAYALGGVLIAGGITELILGPIAIVKSKKQKEEAQQYKGVAFISPPMPVINFASNRPGIGIGTRIIF